MICDPGSEFPTGGRDKQKGENNKWDGAKKSARTVRGGVVLNPRVN